MCKHDFLSLSENYIMDFGPNSELGQLGKKMGTLAMSLLL